MHNPRASLALAAAVALTLVALAGCLASVTGTAQFYVSGSGMEEFEELLITFTRIQIERAGVTDGPDTTVERGADEGGGGPDREGWVFIGLDEEQVDLTAEAEIFLAEERLGRGQYDQFVIGIGAVEGVRADGVREEIPIAAGELLVPRSVNVTGGETTRVVVELDIAGSIQETGETGERVFNPDLGRVRIEEPR